MAIKLEKRKNRISILAWTPAHYDHDEGYFEIGYIKLSDSKNSYMDNWDLDEIFANIQSKEAE